MSTNTESANPAEVLKAQASEAVRKVSDTITDQANVLRDTASNARLQHRTSSRIIRGKLSRSRRESVSSLALFWRVGKG